MELFPLEEKIVKALTKSIKNSWKDNKFAAWTIGVKKSLATLGHKYFFKIRASGSPREIRADYPEWLYDLSWVDEGKSWRELRGLKLISEIEWSDDSDNILKDFQKLTVGVADLRLMVARYRGGKRGDKRLRELVNLCKGACPGSRGFRYLLLGISDKQPSKLRKFAWTM